MGSPDLPSGTITFLFTDIEGSTRLLHQLGDRYSQVLADQRRIVREEIECWNGREVDTQGDSFFISFESSKDAVNAAAEIQRRIHSHSWPQGASVRLRMGLHSGAPLLAEEGYVGLDVHMAARVGNLGYGGQVLLSDTTASSVRERLPASIEMIELGKHNLKDFDHPEPISQLVILGLPCEFPALRSLEACPNNLPTQLTAFVGRQKELDELDALIVDPEVRLLTIFGAGGMGKTRLALAVGEQIVNSIEGTRDEDAPYRDGIYFVPLASLESSSQLESAIARSFGFRFSEGSEPRDQLLDFLGQKELLLILDNFEHLLEGAGLVSEMLNAASQVDVLVTSREKLNLRGERVWPLEGMSYPTASDAVERDIHQLLDEHSALKLFQETARRIAPDFEFDEGTVRAAARICSLVEGMPLAIELAASWVDTFSVQEIQLEIETQLDFLATDARDVPDRHRSVRAVFNSSWGLLDPDERRVFACLSVFKGGFTREAAEFVASASVSILKSLVRKALIKRTSEGRYHMHELMRKYGRERLESDRVFMETTLYRHSEYFSALLESRGADIRRGDTAAIFEEMDNIASGVRHAASLKAVSLLRGQMQSLYDLYDFSGWDIAVREFFEELEGHLRTDSKAGDLGIVYGQVLALLGVANVATSRDAEGIELLNRSQEILRANEAYAELAWANGLRCLNDVLMDFDEARGYFEESLAMYQELVDEWGVAFARCWWANFILRRGLIDQAEIEYLEALQFQIADGDRIGQGWSLTGLAYCEYWRGEYAQALDSFREGLRIYHDLGNKGVMGYIYSRMGDISLLMGEYGTAEANYKDALSVRREYAGGGGIVYSSMDLGNLYLQVGDYERAKAYLADALGWIHETGDAFRLAEVSCLLGDLMIAMGRQQEAWAHYRAAFDLGRENLLAGLCLRLLLSLAKIHYHAGSMPTYADTLRFVYSHPRSDPFTRGLARAELETLDAEVPIEGGTPAEGKGDLEELWNIVGGYLDGNFGREASVNSSRTS